MNNVSDEVLSGVAWKFLERILAQLVTFIVSVVLARMLTPGDYGVVAIINVFITIANVFVVSGLGNALIQKKDADDIDFSSVFYFNIGLSIVLYAGIYIIAPYIADFYKMPLLCWGLRVLGIKLPIAAVNSVQNAFVSRKMIFKKFFFATSIGTVISALVGIGLAFMGAGAWALIAQYLTNSIIDTIVLWYTVSWKPKLLYNWGRLKGLLSFGWKILIQNLVMTSYDQLKSMIIGRKYSSTDLAYYSKGIQFPLLVVGNINSAIGSVLFPALSTYQDDKDKMQQGVRRSITISAFLVFPMMAGLFVVAGEFIPVLLTNKWNDCIPYLRIACIYMSTYVINVANLQAINALGRSDVTLKLEIIKKISGLLLILITMQFGVIYMALADIVLVIIATSLNCYENSKLLGYSLLQQIKDVLPTILRTLVMTVIVYFSRMIMISIDIPIILMLGLEIIIGGLSYILVSHITKSNELKYILNKVKRSRA
ncbi:MAG: lipopolysaccharide biosynthesis protein [Oscillospiraceae bacterium]